MDKLLLIILIIVGLATPTVTGMPPQQLPQQLQSGINGAVAAFTHHPLVQRLLPGIEHLNLWSHKPVAISSSTTSILVRRFSRSATLTQIFPQPA